MPLSDTTIRNAKPGGKPVRLYDSGGLYLEISPAGGKLWRLKYRVGGKEKRLALGRYPQVSLKEARDRREEARKQLASGTDPSAARKQAKAAVPEGFKAVAREWYGKHAPRWVPGLTPDVSAIFERRDSARESGTTHCTTPSVQRSKESKSILRRGTLLTSRPKRTPS